MLELDRSQRWMRVQEAANYARVSVRFIKELLRTRKLKRIKAGRYIVLDRLALDNYLEKLAEQQGASNGDGDVQ